MTESDLPWETESDPADDMTFIEFDGFLVCETEKAIGVGKEEEVKLWIPKSVVLGIEYDVGGDSIDVKVGEKIRSLAVMAWFARKEGL